MRLSIPGPTPLSCIYGRLNNTKGREHFIETHSSCLGNEADGTVKPADGFYGRRERSDFVCIPVVSLAFLLQICAMSDEISAKRG